MTFLVFLPFAQSLPALFGTDAVIDQVELEPLTWGEARQARQRPAPEGADVAEWHALCRTAMMIRRAGGVAVRCDPAAFDGLVEDNLIEIMGGVEEVNRRGESFRQARAERAAGGGAGGSRDGLESGGAPHNA